MLPRLDAHVYRKTKYGADVFVLETGAAIDAEAEAMLQALHSRSTGGLIAHLKRLEEKGAANFMANFYVGYGHKSIGDCGTTTVFAEGISMLAAKAVQDWPLYSGQESSTRFVDFSRQPFLDVTGTGAGREIQEAWREFYLSLQAPVRQHLREKFPRGDGEDAKMWEKAIEARSFDITRAFLPAGATTNISWHTNLRQAADKLALLRHHPLSEIADLADAIEDGLRERYPSSFSAKRYEATETFNASIAQGHYYHRPWTPDFELTENTIRPDALAACCGILKSRPAKTELPRFLDDLGRIQFCFTLDFGSFRDLQRHRGVTQRMPLLTDEIGFHPWYLEELPEVQREQAKQILDIQRKRINQLGLSRELHQYYLPMGYLVSCHITGALPQIVYLIELRATRFVHPTLQMRAVQMAGMLDKLFGKCGLVLHLDSDPGRFDVRRGSHDITEK
ncbi:MAG: FAD-dependent thymidylate synthase [Patescibacteria group bacterium]